METVKENLKGVGTAAILVTAMAPSCTAFYFLFHWLAEPHVAAFVEKLAPFVERMIS